MLLIVATPVLLEPSREAHTLPSDRFAKLNLLLVLCANIWIKKLSIDVNYDRKTYPHPFHILTSDIVTARRDIRHKYAAFYRSI